MPNILSRRTLLEAGGGTLAAVVMVGAASDSRASASQTSQNEKIARAWYKLWGGSTDWAAFDALMADDFAFSSTNGEDHISKAEFKRQCWEPNVSLTKATDIELIMAKGDELFVKYLGHTTGEKSFRNVELLRVRNGKIASIECYFGGKATFPSGVDPQKN